jgi:hypothetical protein
VIGSYGYSNEHLPSTETKSKRRSEEQKNVTCVLNIYEINLMKNVLETKQIYMVYAYPQTQLKNLNCAIPNFKQSVTTSLRETLQACVCLCLRVVMSKSLTGWTFHSAATRQDIHATECEKLKCFRYNIHGKFTKNTCSLAACRLGAY